MRTVASHTPPLSHRARAIVWARSRYVAQGALLLLILVLFAALTGGSKQLSLTADEPPHIAHGYLMLHTGDTWALREHRHPPLLNMGSAWPLLLQPEQPDPRLLPGWQSDFVIFVRAIWPLLGPVARLAFVTRLPSILITVILAALVARWAKTVSGSGSAGGGALLAVAVMLFDPTLTGHAQLATTDMGVTLFSFALLYQASRAKPGISAGLSLGLLLGAALASKGSGVILLPLLVGIWALRCAHALYLEKAKGRQARRIIANWSLSGIGFLSVSLLALWAAYGFRWEPSGWEGLRLPLAGHVDMVKLILMEKSRTAFLAGQLRQGGWWWYYPFAFLVKTPLPLLCLFAIALARLLTRPRQLFHHLGLWLYPALHLATAMASGMNIGYRHLIPMFPFGYVALAAAWRPVLRGHEASRGSGERARLPRWALGGILMLLLLWQGIEAAAVHPFGLAYFNQLAGGSRQGYRYLVDSNFDWGQSFVALAGYLDRGDHPRVQLSYYTWIDPAAYDIQYDPLPPATGTPLEFNRRFDPAPGLYAISATPLQGVMMADPDLYAWFRERTPNTQPGYGLLLYSVEPHPITHDWLAQCTQPVAPLSPEAITSGFGRGDLRQIWFDCTQGWVLPEGGDSPGWYAVHGALRGDRFVNEQLDRRQALLSYRQATSRELPTFDLFLQPQGMPAPRTALDTPVEFGAVTLLGYTQTTAAIKSGRTLEVETWWRVEETPARPLSLMFHLGKPNEAPVAVSDGLAVPVEMWRQGDLLIQRHRLQVPEDAAPGTYALTAGVYWLDTVERWPILSGSHAGDDTVQLSWVEITR